MKSTNNPKKNEGSSVAYHVNVEESNWVQAKREKSGKILKKTAQKKLNQGFGNTFAFSISNRYDALLEEDFSNTKKYKPKKYRNVSDSTISKSSNDDSETPATNTSHGLRNPSSLDFGDQKKRNCSSKSIQKNSIEEVDPSKTTTTIFPKSAKISHSNERNKFEV